ncbi:hypothetical protein Tco_0588703 [Tanacetum coccineum]
MQESIDKNKADADRQFAELFQLLKALQPPTTLPATFPRFEENSRQCFSSDKVEKEELILMSMDKGEVTGPILAVKEDLEQKTSLLMVMLHPLLLLHPLLPIAPVVAPLEQSFVPLERIKQNQAEHHKMFIWYIILKLGYEICLGHLLTNVRLKQEPERAQRRTWDPGITHGDILKQHLEDKINDVEANLEQFKSETLARQKETLNRFDRMQESIDKNKVDADRQFAKVLQLLKALQPPTTLPATIPRFEENSRQCFSSDKVEKEELILTSMDKGEVTGPILAVKEDLEQKLIDDLDEPLIVLESYGMINKNEFADGDVAPVVVVAPIAAIAPVVAPLEQSFVPLERIKQNKP